MTLILSQISSRFALQVGDRLVSLGDNPFDPIANKNVVYLGPDGVVSFGYTGLAYLEDIPTDQWVVEKITGHFYERGERTGTLRLGRLPRWPSIGRAVRALCEELNGLFGRPAVRRLVRGTFFEVVGAGWQWPRRGRARPVLLGIIKNRTSDRCEVYYGARHIGRQYLFSATPDANAALLDQKSLRPQLRGIRSADDAERILVDAIRDVASRTSGVGLNCMSVLLPPPESCKARVKYIGGRVDAQVGSHDGAKPPTVVPAAFSPWIVGPTGVHAPSILSGVFTFTIGTFEVTIEAPEPSGPGIRSVMGSIKRPRAPR